MRFLQRAVITLRARFFMPPPVLKEESAGRPGADPLRAPAVPPDVMAAGVVKLQLSAHPFNHLGSREFSRPYQRPRLSSHPRRNPAMFDGVSFLGPLLCRRRRIPPLPCRSFRSENGGESSERNGKVVPEERAPQGLKRKGALYSLKSLLVRVSRGHAGPGGQYKKGIEKAEAIFFSVSCSPRSSLLGLKFKRYLKKKRVLFEIDVHFARTVIEHNVLGSHNHCRIKDSFSNDEKIR